MNLIDLNQQPSMKLVYTLSNQLAAEPQIVARAQKLTLNESRPEMGLKGVHGLFASKEWWLSVEQGRMPLRRIRGKIIAAYVAGQDPSSLNNTVDLLDEGGALWSIGIYVNDQLDANLFRRGRWVEIVYALDELKAQPAADGGVNYLEIALEMAISP